MAVLDYIARHWRGQLPLPVSYWVNGLLVTLMISWLLTILPAEQLVYYSYRLYGVLAISIWLLLLLITIWQLVGIWRSAGAYLRAGKSRLWGSIARLGVVLGVLGGVVQFTFVAAPQIRELSLILIGKDPQGSYELTYDSDKSTLVHEGAIVFGLTEDIEEMLYENPDILRISLNSKGGRVAEARLLRDLIEDFRLNTFSRAGCYSACTLAFMAGQDRRIAAGAALGFHRYHFPGVDDWAMEEQYRQDKLDWESRGIDPDFIRQAYETPHGEIWKPSPAKLYINGVITHMPRYPRPRKMDRGR